MHLRIATVQTNAVVGQVKSNTANISKLVAQAVNKNPLDILLLPELALTGYNFKSPAAIEPFLEPTSAGVSTDFARQLSKKYNCFTMIGYPEKAQSKTYNSAVFTSPTGEVLHHYRKSHLYETDEVWGCSENPGTKFEAFKFVADKNYYHKRSAVAEKVPVITAAAGICMDLNPYKFEAPFTEYEMARSCLENNVHLILCPMAWLSVTTVGGTSRREGQPEIDTVGYWVQRFSPLVDLEQPVAVVTSNRTGAEDNVLYAGSSTAFVFEGVRDKKNPVSFFGALPCDQAAVKVFDLDVHETHVEKNEIEK